VPASAVPSAVANATLPSRNPSARVTLTVSNSVVCATP